LTWGHKFSTLEGFEKDIFRMGYDPTDQRIIMISDDVGQVYKIYYLKRLIEE